MQAGLIAYLEGQLHGGALEEGRQTYPAYLVLLTSLIGLTLTSKAQEGSLIGRPSAGIIYSIYVAKLSLLILPQVCFQSAVLSHTACSNSPFRDIYVTEGVIDLALTSKGKGW